MKPIRQKHNYTSELELKSLLIRCKNKKNKVQNEKYNRVINKYVKWYTKINNSDYEKTSEVIQRRKILKQKIKDRIVKLSELTSIDAKSNDRFGEIILLMIKSILTKPNFSGYTYHTEFYSDAIGKILKYLHNFNHMMISERSGTFVNSFAYISQIIHNSIIFVINDKKKEQHHINKQITNEIISNNLNIADHKKDLNKSTIHNEFPDIGFQKEEVKTYKLTDNIIPGILEILANAVDNERPLIYYPDNVILTMEDYNTLKPLLKRASIIRYPHAKL